MHYTTSNKARRHKFIDEAVGGLNTILNNVDLERGHVSEAKVKMYRSVIRRLVVPNINHDIAQVTKRQKSAEENYVPLLVLDPYETICCLPEDAALSPQQSDILSKQQLINPAVEEGFREYLHQRTLLTVPPAETGMDAFVCREHIKTFTNDRSARGVLSGRPILALVMHGAKLSASYSSILAHEIEHIKQVESSPFTAYENMGQVWDRKLGDELYAYREQANLERERLAQTGSHETYNYSNYPTHLKIADQTQDAELDSNGYVVLDDEYRPKVARRLVESGLIGIAPNLNASDAERAKRF